MSKQPTVIETSSGSASARVDDTGQSHVGYSGGEAGSWRAVPDVRVGQRVDIRDGRAGRVSRLRRDPQSHLVTHFVVSTRRFLGRDLLVPGEWATSIWPKSIYLDVNRADLDRLPVYRTDEEIAGDVEAAFGKDDLLRHLCMPVSRVDVRDGVVTLRGHVASRSHQDRAEEATRRVRGVLEVRAELVADDELEVTVARALAGDPRTRPYFIQVHAFQGIVHLVGALQGTTPSSEARAAAREVAASVPGVRCVVDGLVGPSTVAEPLLPHVGLPVYDADGDLGRLVAVVMSRRFRQVTHLVVASRLPLAGVGEPTLGAEPATRRLLVPVRVVAHATADAIYLRGNRAAASQLPEYRGNEYSDLGSTWQPKFDYRWEDVRFAVEGSASQLTSAALEPIAA